MFDRSLPESEEGADEGQRHRDAEPQCQQSHQREEGDGRGRALVPKNEVHDEEQREDDPDEKIGLKLFFCSTKLWKPLLTKFVISSASH